MAFIGKKNLYIFCFLFFTIKVQAQSKVIDSLKNELSLHTQKDTIQVKILNDLAFWHYRQDPPKSVEYAERARRLADEIQYPKGNARSLYMRGIAQMAQSDLETSIQSLQDAIGLYNAINVKSGIAGCYNALGVIYNNMGEQERALESYQKAMEIDRKLEIDKNIPNYLYNIGNIYADRGEYNSALINFKKALDEYVRTKNDMGILYCWNSLAIVYVEQGNYPLALEYHNNSLNTAMKSQDTIGIFQSLNNIGNTYKEQEQFDKALEFYEKALAIKQKDYDQNHMAIIESNLASIYIHKKEYDKAIAYLESAISFNERLGNTSQLGICYFNLGQVYLERKGFSIALSYFRKALEISIENDERYEQAQYYLGLAEVYYHQNKDELALFNATKSLQIAEELQLIKYSRNAYGLMSNIYSRMGQYEKAFSSHQQFKILNDSLFNKENIEKITQLEYEYQYKQKLDSANTRELILKQTVNTTFHDLEKSQRKSFIAIIVILLVSIISGAVIFFLKLKHANTRNQNILIEQKLLRSQMTPHFMFNSLSVLQGMILNKEEGKSLSYLSKFSKLLRTTLENSRHKLVALSEELSATDSYVELQNLDANPPYNYSLTVDPDIDPTVFKIPPMLIQPFIENIIEHAFVSKREDREINVQIELKDEKLICTIADNGIGIKAGEPKIRKNKNSLATTITSERLEMISKEFKMQGSISIKNRELFGEQGTLVTLVIPYKIDSVS